MIRLFLANKEVELNESVSFAITKQFEDVTSPADIKNDYSKTVNIPFTQINNKLFGSLFSADRLIVEGDSSLMGVYFDPYKKIDFRLQWGDAVMMQGYAKVISISKDKDGGGSYEISLNGELGKVFQEIKKITFDSNVDDKKYWIDGRDYVDEVITKDLVYNLWTEEPDFSRLPLQKKYIKSIDASGSVTETPNMAYRINDYIGFAPNNSYEQDFDHKTFQLGITKSKKFADVLDERSKTNLGGDATYVDAVGVDASTVIGNGLLPRDIGEFRSYLQLPYLYFNKLFQIFVEKSKEITDYDFYLDDRWFNTSNPYWSRLVYMMKKINSREVESQINIYDLRIFAKTLSFWTSSTPPTQELIFDVQPNQNYSKEKTPVVDWGKNPPVFNISDKVVSPQTNYNGMILQCDAVYDSKGNRLNSRLNTSNGLVLEVRYVYDNGYIDNTRFLYIDENSTVSYNSDDYYEVYKLGAGDDSGAYYTKWNLSIPLVLAMYNRGDCKNVKIELSAKWLNNNASFDNTTYGRLGNNANLNVEMLIYQNHNRSFSKFTLNDLWNNDRNVFDVILNYCKMFRIGIFCDTTNKKVSFIPLQTYFKDYKVLDWTDKLDMSKDYTINPLTFGNKYVLFNYEKDTTYLNEDYIHNTGLNYGELKISTDYEFNNESKKLFNNIKIGIPYTDTVLSWNNIYENQQVLYTIPKEIYVYNRNKDKKVVDIRDSFMMYGGLGDFDTTSNLKKVSLSDDTSLQLGTQKFFYSQYLETIRVSTYPILGYKGNDRNLSVFNIPSSNFTHNQSYFNGTRGIYKNFWENYLNERYNKQNKIITCYLRLNPYDVLNFEYNNFIQIENQLYMVNKIYDYQIDENVSTKVDLITVQDLEGYTKGNFDYIYISGVTPGDTLELGTHMQKYYMYVSSYSDVNVTVDVEEGDVADCYINGINLLDLSHGYGSITIKAGVDQELIFNTLSGGSDCKMTVTLTNENGDSISFKIIVIW